MDIDRLRSRKLVGASLLSFRFAETSGARVIKYVNVCDDGRCGYGFGNLWASEREAREEAKYLMPVPIGVAVTVNIAFEGDQVRSAIRAFERAGVTT